MTAFRYKGFGRIYTDPDKVGEVEDILIECDPEEYRDYYPKNLVAGWDSYPLVEYVGKFELNLAKFHAICKERGIPVFVFNAKSDDSPRGYAEVLSRGEIEILARARINTAEYGTES